MFNFFKKKEKTISKNTVARMIATAWKELDADVLEDILADDVEFRSLATKDVIKGKQEYLKYINEKFKTFREHNMAYRALDVDFEDSVAVKLDDPENLAPTAYLVFEYDGKHVTSILMRPANVYTMDDLQDQEKAQPILRGLIDKVKEGITRQVAVLRLKQNEFEWLQPHVLFNAPAFQHLGFRARNTVFSVRIGIRDLEDNYIELGNATPENQMAISQHNDLVPLRAIIDINGLTPVQLVDAATGEPVDLATAMEQGSGQLSAWEMNHYAVQIAIQQLMSHNCQLVSYTDAPGVVPQIFFENEGQPGFVLVIGKAAGNTNPFPPMPQTVIDLQKQNIKGYFAGVSLYNLDGDPKATTLERNGLIGGDIEGSENADPLMTIDEAAARYGVSEAKA